LLRPLLTEPPRKPRLEIVRVLPAPPSAVFAAFTEADRLRKWWGPRGFTIPSLRFEPGVGETYRIEMQPPDGDAFDLGGEFRDVEPESRLAFTFVWDPPGPDDVETLAELTFRDADGSTETSLSQGPFKTDERRDLHRDGWTESFDRLEAMLRGQGEGHAPAGG
jgi:uncharacterized protein YndB with AHSA1/START domain